MGEEITYPINDTNRQIERIIRDLKAFESPLCDGRIKAIILTNLEQAQLWSLKLVKEAENG
jgi:hypothetical protein